MTFASHLSVRSGQAPLIGREEELRVVVDTLVVSPSVVFLGGEAGIGKSRLVAELAQAPTLAGRVLTAGHCQPSALPFPYGPVLDGLRGCTRRLPEPGELSPVVGALAAILPELAARLPRMPAPLADAGAERHRLFRAVRELLVAAGPVVFVVEDLHWADDGSRDLLRFLLADPPPELGLVLTYRPEDVPGGGGPLGGAVRSAPGTSVARVHLGPLDVSATRLLAKELAGRHVALDAAKELQQNTAGIPFVIEEAVQALSFGMTAEVPVVVTETVAERMAALSPDARRVAQAAAVLAMPAGLDLIGEVAGLDGQCRRTAVTAALTGTVLVETGADAYAFRHGLARRAVYRSLPGPERTELHIRAVRALRRLDPPPLGRIAEHSRLAGRREDWLRYGEAAADQMVTDDDAPSAIALLQQLLAEPWLTAADVDRLALKFSRVAFTGLDQSDVTALMQRLMSDTRLTESARGEIRLGLGLLLMRQAHGLELARAELERAVGELRSKPDLAWKGMSVLAEPFVGTVPLSENRRWMAEVDKTIDNCDRPVRTMLLANNLGSALHTGDPKVWDRVRLLPKTVDDREEQRQLTRAHLNLADACSWVGHYERAHRFVRSGLQLGAPLGVPYIIGTGEGTQLRLDWHAGRWTGLAERAGALLESYRELLPITTELSLVLGSLAITRGEWDLAERYLDDTGIATPENAFAPVVIAAYAATTTMMLARDELDAACSAADRGVNLVRRKEVWAWAGELVPVVVQAYCRAGRAVEAKMLLSDLRAGIDGLDTPLADAAVPAAAAFLDLDRGDHTAAASGFEQARHAYKELGRRYDALLHAENALLCRMTADGIASVATGFTELADELDELGATRDAARCRHLLRTSGAASPSRRGRRGYGNALSPREQDVAGLLANGHTNREIAQVLFLSQRTVEQHVANVLRKLGVTSRRDLAERPHP